MEPTVSLHGWWLGALSYALVHLIHIVIWRVKLVVRDVQVLTLVFIVYPTLAWIGVCGSDLGISWAALVVHLVLSVHYIAVYPAAQATSPTLEMLYQMSRRADGITREELVTLLGGEDLISDRLADLERGEMIAHENGKLVLRKRARSLANLFYYYRRSIGLPAGAG